MSSLIIKVYQTLKYNNFIYFIRELELRYYLRNKTYNEKFNEIKFILDYSLNICNFNFYDNDFIIDIDKNNYIEDSDAESDEDSDV